MLSEIDDKEEVEMLKEESNGIKVEFLNFEEEFKILLIFKDLNDDKDVIVEIRVVVGGDEVVIFVGDLMCMYLKYVEL